jgi:FkbM family methyltransferase
MFQVRGFWLPDGETHFGPLLRDGPEFAGGPTYQLRKLLPMMQHINNFRHCIDIGAHCGMWARPLARMFTHVTAFEPVARHVACFKLNVDMRNVTLHEMALGDTARGPVTLHTFPDSTGNTIIAREDGEYSSTMSTLDTVIGDAQPVDFIKIDCEGYEYFVLKGGERLIRKHKPTILVEQKHGKGSQFGIADDAGLKLLVKWGARQVFVMSGDFGFVFK